MAPADRHRVVVVGGGFGGLYAARGLARAPVELTLVDRRNHHVFQPLLYQVATGGLSPSDIAAPLRQVLGRQRNARVLLGEVVDLDVEGRRVLLADGALPYDSLVVATGAEPTYFGHDGWQRHAPGLKDLEDATRIRARILMAFERAEREPDPERVRALLTFVIVGAGPTGVELAGAIAELERDTLRGDFRSIDTSQARILLVEAGERVLGAFPESLSAAAERSLARLGVEVLCKTLVTDVGSERVRVRRGESELEIPTACVVWAAGVRPSPMAPVLAERAGAEIARGGRVVVGPDLSLPGRPEVFVVGDLAQLVPEGESEPLPALAAVAMQQGRFVARAIRRRLAGAPAEAFRYRDKGLLATVGRSAAVARLWRLELSGFVAWVLWLFVHLMYLVGFANKLLVLLQWAWNYATLNRTARLITQVPAAPSQGGSGERARAPEPELQRSLSRPVREESER